MNRTDELLAMARDEYERGYLAGLWAFAWWKDGTAYVGTTGTTFVQAAERFLRERGALA